MGRWGSCLVALAALLWAVLIASASDRRQEATSWPTVLVGRTAHLKDGTLMYFLVERSKYTSRIVDQWEIRAGRCHGCGREGTVIRFTLALGHDKLHHEGVESRCLECLQKKLPDLGRRGTQVFTERELLRVVHDLEKGK